MRLAHDGSAVKISMPVWCRTAEAVAFASSRRDWLAGQLAKIPDAMEFGQGSMLNVRGEAFRVVHDPAAPRLPTFEGATLRVGGPAPSLFGRLKRWLEAEALSLLADDLAGYCSLAGQPVPALALSTARRRWGSCAADGTIRINWRLIMAPDFVRRSVVAHEVAHLVHFDHSTAFHACLSDLFEGSVAEANSWLRRHGRELYQPFG